MPNINERHRKIQLKYTQAVLGTKEVSEVFMLAVDGLHQDLPATKVLRRRLEVLIDRFVRDIPRWIQVGWLPRAGILVGYPEMTR